MVTKRKAVANTSRLDTLVKPWPVYLKISSIFTLTLRWSHSVLWISILPLCKANLLVPSYLHYKNWYRRFIKWKDIETRRKVGSTLKNEEKWKAYRTSETPLRNSLHINGAPGEEGEEGQEACLNKWWLRTSQTWVGIWTSRFQSKTLFSKTHF